jgi:diacylglycerol O-acyltransferase / wax synthase
MTRARLSAFDASFLAIETPTAHMHVGWVAIFSPPVDGELPSFSELRDHIGSRLARAPRYRQRLAPVPFGVLAAEWVDDDAFSVERHVYRARGPLGDLVDEVMSVPLRRDRPLWEMWICEDTEREWFAIVGKAHHCMIDGTAAIELTSLLLDVTPEPAACEPDVWRAVPAPSAERLLVRGVRDLVGDQLGLLHGSLRAAISPARAAKQTVSGALRATRAVGHSLRAAPASLLNRPLTPLRSLAWTQRPLADLQLVKRNYGMTVNDVLLAAVAGGMRTYMIRRREEPVALKVMVPVNVRSSNGTHAVGNQISFVFVELPCDEPQPLGRLYQVRSAMSQRKRDGAPEGADLLFKAAARTPVGVQRAISRLVASPRTFNLVVSNVPGPRAPLFMLGCPLKTIYPVVPLADQHAVSIGMTTVGDQACFGIYADRQALPDVGVLARDIDNALTELLACVDPSVTVGPWLKPLQISARRLAPLAPLAAEEESVTEDLA